MSMSGDPGQRVGTSEREAAIAALNQHWQAGRLDPAEHERRTTAAYAAVTRGDLDALFADLPGGDPATRTNGAAPAPLQGEVVASPSQPGDRTTERHRPVPLRLVGRGASRRADGDHAVRRARPVLRDSKWWPWFLLIPAAGVVLYSGDDRRKRRRDGDGDRDREPGLDGTAQDAAALIELALRSKGYLGYDASFLEACRAELTLSADQAAAARVVRASDGAVRGCHLLVPDPAGHPNRASCSALRRPAGHRQRGRAGPARRRARVCGSPRLVDAGSSQTRAPRGSTSHTAPGGSGRSRAGRCPAGSCRCWSCRSAEIGSCGLEPEIPLAEASPGKRLQCGSEHESVRGARR